MKWEHELHRPKPEQMASRAEAEQAMRMTPSYEEHREMERFFQ
jgi:hypothetical protein